jgi:5-(carboxyamino)imidazole ribonucleotide synthase
MKPPYIGIITQAWGESTYQNEAVKLGVQIKFENIRMTAERLVEFAQDLDFIYVDPKIISLPTIKSAEKSGVKVYPNSKTLEKIDQISLHSTHGESLSILVARSAHAQAVTWPITLLTGDLSITPLPGITDEISQEIQVSALKLANEVNLVGGFEIHVDAVDYKRLIGLNYLTPNANYWSQIGCVTNFYEQSLRAILDLPLGSIELLSSYVVTGELETDLESDDYRPYLHLMARNPKLKFDQSIKQVGIIGEELETLLTEVIHAQQYYSGKILE